MEWNDLKYFLAVARSGSLTDASRVLRTSASTVSRRVGTLEDSLGKPLFSRRPDGYVLNETGQRLIAQAERVEATIAAMERTASASEIEAAGDVSLAVPELLGIEYLIPRLTGLLDRHPEITLEFLPNVLPVRLSRRAADIALRVIRPSHGDYLVRRVGALGIALYAAPSYVERHGMLDNLADLDHHRIVGWTGEFRFLEHVNWLETQIGDQPPSMRTSNMTAQYRAACSGLCIAALPAVLAEETGLVRMVPDEEPLVLDLWLAMHSETQGLRRVRAVADFIIDLMAAEAGRLNPF